MELVQGIPLTEFCARNHLSVAERLRLFLPVCHAVQHAHQKGVIHRDLKPSNILVTQSHGAPHPLIIDFGVAKATQQRLTEKTIFTNFGTLLGTPAYMSPEQAEPGREDVDTRSDLYSLGVLLYELLTGTTPFSEQRLRSAGLGEMLRILREEEPERPSTRLTKQHARGAVGTPAAVPARPSALDAGLDWIVMKCLEKDRRRRYETVNGLAADLQRHLASEPVIARPPSTAYRLQKLVRRHRVAVAAGAAVVLALIVGLAAAIWQAVRATRAERAFQAQAETATSVKDFLVQQVLRHTNAWGQKRFDPNDRVLVERIARELEGRFTNQPLVEAELRIALGFGFGDLDDWPRALQQAERLLAIRKAHRGATHPDTLFAASAVGNCLYNVGRHREADQMLDEAIATARAAFGDLRKPLREVPPQRPDEWEALVRATAALEGWPAAADLCQAQIDAFPDSISLWLQKGRVFRFVSKEKEYREVVDRVLALPHTSNATNEQHLPIEIAGLAPIELTPTQHADLEARIQGLEASLTARTAELRRLGHRAIGQRRLRTGELQRALENLERAETAQPGPDVGTLYLNSLCLSRLNRRADALAALHAADRLADAEIPSGPESEAFLHPSQLYQAILLRREAHAELGDP